MPKLSGLGDMPAWTIGNGPAAGIVEFGPSLSAAQDLNRLVDLLLWVCTTPPLT